MQRHEDPYVLLVGMRNGAVTLENSPKKDPQIVKY